MSVPPSPDPLTPPPGPPPGPQVPPAGPQMPATRATPEKLVALLVNIANRLERLEGIVARMDDSTDRLERRFDGLECRSIAFGDSLHTLLLIVGRLPPLRQIVFGMLAVVAASVLSFAIGLTLATHWPWLRGMLG